MSQTQQLLLPEPPQEPAQSTSPAASAPHEIPATEIPAPNPPEKTPPASPSAPKPKRRSLEERHALAEEKLKKAQADKDRLDKELDQKNRTARNGQLIAWGIGVETLYKKDSASRQRLRKRFSTLLDEKNRVRAEAGFDRLDRELLGDEIQKPETPFS